MIRFRPHSRTRVQPDEGRRRAEPRAVAAPGRVADSAGAAEPARHARAAALWADGKIAQAEACYRRALAAAPDDFEALVGLGRLRLAAGDAAGALPLIAAAFANAPESPEALAGLGAALFALRLFDDALAVCERVLKLNPLDFGALFNRGAALMLLGRHREALDSFDAALNLNPNLVGAILGRANALAVMGRDEDALASYNRLLSLAPNHAEALNHQGLVLARIGLHDAALTSYDRALSARPDFVGALINRGEALRALGRQEEALACFDRVLARDPEHVAALAARARILCALGDPAEALGLLDRVLARHPDDADAIAARAGALQMLGRVANALAASEAALARDPDNIAALLCRADALCALDRPADARAAYRDVLARQEENTRAFAALGEIAVATCDFDGIAAFQQEMDRRVARGTALLQPRSVVDLVPTADHQRDWIEHYAQAMLPPVEPLAPRPALRLGKCRIAYLAGDFAALDFADTWIDIVASHDRDRFEVVGVALAAPPGAQDERVVAAFDRFYDLSRSGTLGAARLLHSLDTSILVDFCGYAVGARPVILAHRPAPIQVGAPGFPATRGTPAVDYLIADSVALPQELEPYFHERIVRLPGCCLPLEGTSLPSRRAGRAAAGLPAEAFVFCAPAPPTRIGPGVFQIWMRLLKAVKGAVLWLPAPTSATEFLAAENLRRTASSQGIDPTRLVFSAAAAATGPRAGRLGCADLALDTAPQSGAASVAAALRCGLPAVTCAGTSLAGRLGASVLAARGLTELVADDLAQYEALALRFARDPAALARLREQLNRPGDAAAVGAFCRHLESAYLTMWDIHCAGDPPRGFDVAPT